MPPMTGKPSDMTIAAWARLLKAQAKALDAVETDLKAKGLPPLAWYDVLLELKREENSALRPLELEKRLLLKQHNVSRLIDRMERKNLLKRLPYAGDGRGQLVASPNRASSCCGGYGLPTGPPYRNTWARS